MSREQIEKMAKTTIKHCKIYNQCGSCHWSTCNECLAEVFYNAGYRKQSAVIDEFVERLKIRMMCTSQISREFYMQVSSLAEEIVEEMKGGAG